MNLVMVSTDRGLLDPSSRVCARFRMYATLFTKLDVILCVTGNYDTVSIAPNTHVYPTNSTTKFRYIADATRIGRMLEADVVSGQDPFEIGVIAYRIARILRAKLHVQVHTDVFSEGFSQHSLLNRIRVRIALWLLPKAQGVRVVSERIARSITKRVHKLRTAPIVLPIAVEVPAGVVPMHFPFAQTVLMVSRLESEKHVAEAIDGFLRVHESRPETGLVIIGDGSLRSELEAKVAAQHASSHVQFLGAVPNVFDAYAGADVFLQVSAYEGYGMTLLEAALMGKAIVTTDVGIVGEVLVDGGSCLVTSGTPVDIATKLGVLLDEAPFMSTLGGRAREVAQAHVQDSETYATAYAAAFTIQ